MISAEQADVRVLALSPEERANLLRDAAAVVRDFCRSDYWRDRSSWYGHLTAVRVGEWLDNAALPVSKIHEGRMTP